MNDDTPGIETILPGGSVNAGTVVRRDDAVHRSRGASAPLVEALLLHLERAGFEGAPRFRGHDEVGRQVLSFVEGDTYADRLPPWVDDDDENARVLARVAALLRRLHDATTGFEPPAGARPLRSLPLPGDVWNHGDVHYGNVVFRERTPVGLVDWDFTDRASRLYDPLTLLVVSRCPRPGRTDNDRRATIALRTLDAVLDGYGVADADRSGARVAAAVVFDDIADYVEANHPVELQPNATAFRFLAGWFRSVASGEV